MKRRAQVEGKILYRKEREREEAFRAAAIREGQRRAIARAKKTSVRFVEPPKRKERRP